MFGKIFASLYTGSMIGAGPVPFALMPYIIAHAVPDREVGGHVELNPILLSTIIGTSVEEIEKAIEYLCSPDPRSRTPDEQGRRLIKLGPYDYRVVNYPKYRAIKDEEDRRESNRIAQQKHRDKKEFEARLKAGAEGLDLSLLTPAQRRVWERARAKGVAAVTRQIDRDGEVAGRTEQVLKSLEEANRQAQVDGSEYPNVDFLKGPQF